MDSAPPKRTAPQRKIHPTRESVSMKRIRLISTLLPALLLTTTLAFAVDWHTGKLMDTEKQEVPTGSTTHYNTDAQAKNGKYSQNSTAHTTDDTDTYQVFTIQTPTKTYVVRQKLNFPWSKPANISLGEEVKFMVQGNKMTILDDDQKQQKATVVKASVTHSHQ
jgi:flagellar basal body-associated protein FliL